MSTACAGRPIAEGAGSMKRRRDRGQSPGGDLEEPSTRVRPLPDHQRDALGGWMGDAGCVRQALASRIPRGSS